MLGACDAEVDDARARRRQHDVRRLEVAVDEARRVDVGEGVCEGGGEGAQGGFGERPVRLDGLVEGEARQELGGHPRSAALGPGAEDVRNSLAAYGLCGLCLADEPLGEVRVVGEFGLEHLDRGERPGAVLTDVHLPHAALAEHAEDAVGTEAEGVADAEGFHVGPSAGRRSWNLCVCEWRCVRAWGHVIRFTSWGTRRAWRCCSGRGCACAPGSRRSGRRPSCTSTRPRGS